MQQSGSKSHLRAAGRKAMVLSMERAVELAVPSEGLWVSLQH